VAKSLSKDTSTWTIGTRVRTADPLIEGRPRSPLSHGHPQLVQNPFIARNVYTNEEFFLAKGATFDMTNNIVDMFLDHNDRCSHRLQSYFDILLCNLIFDKRYRVMFPFIKNFSAN